MYCQRSTHYKNKARKCAPNPMSALVAKGQIYQHDIEFPVFIGMAAPGNQLKKMGDTVWVIKETIDKA